MIREVEFPGGMSLKVLAFRAERHNFARWEHNFLETLIRHLKYGYVVFDIGAEEGEFSAIVGKIVGGRNVHLFEPSPFVWPNIKAVWDANHLSGPGRCFPGFASHISRQGSIERITSNWPQEVNGPIQLESSFPTVVEYPHLPAISIDDYCAATNIYPDVVIMDVEGAEGLAVQGMAGILKSHSPLIFISIHISDFMSKYGYEQERVFRYLSFAGYVGYFIYADLHESHWAFRREVFRF